MTKEFRVEEARKREALKTAAPDMLAALKRSKDHINDEIGQFGARTDYRDTDTIAIIDAAIAKAEGKV